MLLDPNVKEHILEKISVKKDHDFHKQHGSMPVPIQDLSKPFFQALEFLVAKSHLLWCFI